jgi:hypothetical protein
MSANHRAVGDGGCLVYVDSEFAENLRPAILLCPVSKPVVDALPVAEPLGQVTPLDPSFRAEDHGVDEQAVASRRLAALGSPWQQRLQSCPLLVCKGVALHEQL